MIKIQVANRAYLDVIPEDILDSLDSSDVFIDVYKGEYVKTYPIEIRWDISLEEFEKNVKKLISVAQHPMGKMFLNAINKIIKP